jgi:ferritin-like metal-binding protein YciE
MAKTTSKKSASKGSSSSGKASSSNSASKGTSRSSTASKSSSASRSGIKLAPKSASKSAPKKSAVSSTPKKAAPKKVAAKSSPKKVAAQPVSISRSVGRYASQGNDQGMLQELFHDELKDIYWAEKHLLKALPKMRKAATSSDLQKAFDTHLQQTQQQVQRLEQVFELLGKKAQGKKCEAMDGLTKEADGIISDTKKGTMTRDVGLILAAQKVEHYEIATYGGLATVAATLGNQQIKELLGQTLQEEKETDELLTKIAEGHVNQQAANNESKEANGTSSIKENSTGSESYNGDKS